jgi:hypothetical protein
MGDKSVYACDEMGIMCMGQACTRVKTYLYVRLTVVGPAAFDTRSDPGGCLLVAIVHSSARQKPPSQRYPIATANR